MADVLWVLLCLANQTGINLEIELQKALKRKQKGTQSVIKTIQN